MTPAAGERANKRRTVLNNIIGLIVDTVATVVAAALLLRFWLQRIRVKPPEPVARMIFSLSNWLVLPVRRVLPGFGGYDWASILGAMLMAALSTVPVLWATPYFTAWHITLLSAQQLANWVLYGLMGLLIMEAIISWINPYAPIAPFLGLVNAPLLRPLRHLIPRMGGLDFSILVALILLRIALYLTSAGLAALA